MGARPRRLRKREEKFFRQKKQHEGTSKWRANQRAERRGSEQLPRPGFILCVLQGRHIQQTRDRLTAGQEQRESNPERGGQDTNYIVRYTVLADCALALGMEDMGMVPSSWGWGQESHSTAR